MAVRELSNDEIARLAERFGLSVANNDKGQPREIAGGVPQRILSQFDAEVERLTNSPPPLPEEYAMEDRVGQSTLHSDPAPPRMDIDPGESSSPDRSFLDTAVPMAIRVVPAVVGSAVGSLGGPIGTSAGGAVGGALGEALAQKYEVPGENDINWRQVAVQGGLNATPFNRMGNIPGVRQASARLAATSAGRIFGRSASASTPAQRVIREFPRTVAAASGRGAVIGAASGTPTRMAADQPTTMGDIVRDIGYGAAIGGALPVAGRAAIESKNLAGRAARNEVINPTLSAGAASLGGYVGYRSGGPYGAATGAIAGYGSAQTILNKMKKWGLPSTEKGTENLYKLSPEKIQADIESITDDISKIEHLSVDIHAKELKRFASGVAYIRANGLTVSQKTDDQLARINDLMLTPKANTALRSMAAPEFLNEDKLIDIGKFTSKEVSKYHNDLAEAIDAASRAGREIPEKWRQAFEGLRERIHGDSSRDYSSAIERLMKSALVDRKSFDAAFKSLSAKIQGEIRGKDSALLDILERRSENVGGKLAGQASGSTGLLEIIEGMRRPMNVELPGPASHGGFTIPTDASARIKRAEEIIALIEEHNMAGTLTPTPFQTVLDDTGVASPGALIYTYTAGTTTAAATYTTSALSVANANPIVADSAGRYVAYLAAGANMKFVYKTAAGATIRTQDNVLSVPGAAVNLDIQGTVGVAVTAGQVCYLSSGAESPALTPGLWYLTDADFAVSSTTCQSIGMAVSAIPINTAGTIRIAGLATTAAAVVVGSTYYVSATAGAITTSAPALSRVVGVADTTSTLILAATSAVAATLPNPISQDLLFVDATYDIGKSGASRPRDLFQSRNATIGGTLGVTGATTLSSTLASGALTVTG
jgi:hypothetical protein